MNLRFKIIILILSIKFCTLLNAQDLSSINLIKAGSEATVISKYYLHSSKEASFSIDEVVDNDDAFKFEEKTFLNSGIFKPYNWVKLKLCNTSNNKDFIFEFNQTYIDSLEFYQVKEGEIVKTYPKKGLYFEANNKPSYLSNKYAYIYPIHLPKGDTLMYYLHVVVNDGAYRGMNKVWTKDAYQYRIEDVKVRSAYLIFFGGFTVLVIVISIAMFFFSRQTLYLFYAGFVTVIFANLLGLRYFLSPLFFEKYLFFGNNFLEMFTLIQTFFVTQYLKHFFSLKKYYPKLYVAVERFALFILGFFLIALILRQFDWFYSLSYYAAKLLLLVVTIGFYTIAIKLCFKKEIMAYYFVIAYFPLMLVVLHYLLTALKLTSGFSPIEWEFVIFFEIIVLTIAMAHRYYLLIQENIAYQKKLYEQRLKISRDLHDNIGAQLTFIISSIENLPYGFNITNSKLTDKLQNISAFTKDTIYELRDTIWAMNKNNISLEDLQIRISNFVKKASSHAEQVRFNFYVAEDVSKDIVFSSVAGMNIYRIIQESVNNAFKYAEPKTILVSIEQTDVTLNFAIVDDGKGFDLNTIEKGNGLNNMKKRSNDIGAIITIESETNKGTAVKLALSI